MAISRRQLLACATRQGVVSGKGHLPQDHKRDDRFNCKNKRNNKLNYFFIFL